MRLLLILKFIFIAPIAQFVGIAIRNKPFEERYRVAQKWSQNILQYLGYKLHVSGVENVPKEEAIYFVCNHQGTLDPVLIVASCPVPLSFISKKENEKMPIFGRWARNIDTIHFERTTREGNVFMLRSAVKYLKSNKNLLIFPEGTRSKQDEMNAFKEGAIQPAYMGKATIVPITINNAYCIDDKNNKDKDLYITYLPPISYEEYSASKPKETSDKVHALIRSQIRF